MTSSEVNINDKLYEEWKSFLTSDRDDLRLAAVSAVLQVRDFSGMEECVRQGMVPLLAKNTGHPTVAVDALQALVHLSSNGPSANQCIQDLLETSGLNRMLEIVLSKPEEKRWNEKVNFAMSLLANMTRTEAGAVGLVGLSLPEEPVVRSEAASSFEGNNMPTKPTLDLLLARFLNPAFVQSDIQYEALEEAALDSNAEDPYQHFAAVLVNSTQTEAGRRFVLKIHRHGEDETSVLQKILPQLRSPNTIRRRGIVGTVRNCCLDKDSAWWLLNTVSITKHLLYPLAGPEELDVEEKQGLDPDLWLEGPDKRREPDHLTRLWLVESVLLLCSSGRQSRTTLRLQCVYVILKWADMVEEHEDVSERISDCVNFLRRDEEGTAEGSSDKMVEDAYRKPMTSRQVGNEDFDSVD